MKGTLRLNELYGPTLQGEGPHAGLPLLVLRLAGCNLDCVWCDTSYAWDWNRHDVKVELQQLVLSDVAAMVQAQAGEGCRRVLLTGGEPLLQAAALYDLSRLMPGWSFDVETNGTLPMPAHLRGVCDVVTVSPKLPSSGVPAERALRLDVLEQLLWLQPARTVLKFVVQDDADLEAADSVVAALALTGSRVWLMPQAATVDRLQQVCTWTAQQAIDRGWCYSDRLHLRLWPGVRRA